eukprot:6201429-Pleurochrysis_carterae.AAC.1
MLIPDAYLSGYFGMIHYQHFFQTSFGLQRVMLCFACLHDYPVCTLLCDFIPDQNDFTCPRCGASTHARDGAAPTAGRRPPCSP